MKRGSLWKVTVGIAPSAEDEVRELLEDLSGQPACVYTDAQNQDTTASVYLDQASDWSDARRRELIAGLERLRARGVDVGPAAVSVERIRREDWAESWKRHFKPFTIGGALLVKPSWSARRAQRGQKVVILDPGLSFGTGQHPTTRFCLRQIVACRRRNRPAFLDVGTGSGILAIAAAKLGYRQVVGFDFDPDAVRIARANARLNGVSGKVLIRHQDISQLPTRGSFGYDLICANLTADLLMAHKDRLMNRLQSNGRLVLAGILDSQFAEIRHTYEASGLVVVAQLREQEWESAAFTMRPAQI
jgi:ribosomal protein L11 methyltransferase